MENMKNKAQKAALLSGGSGSHEIGNGPDWRRISGRLN